MIFGRNKNYSKLSFCFTFQLCCLWVVCGIFFIIVFDTCIYIYAVANMKSMWCDNKNPGNNNDKKGLKSSFPAIFENKLIYCPFIIAG